MTVKYKKELRKFLRASLNLILVFVILLFQFSAPLLSNATCNGNQPACPPGQNYICPAGKAPCCFVFSGETGCSNGISCNVGEGHCGTSSDRKSTRLNSSH